MAKDEVDVSVEPKLRAGAWADWWRVSFTRDGFKIDFGMRQPYAPDQVLIVARVLLPWRGPVDLIADLEAAWDDFSDALSEEAD